MLTIHVPRAPLLVFQKQASPASRCWQLPRWWISIPEGLGIQARDADIGLEESLTVTAGALHDRLSPDLRPGLSADRMACDQW